MKLLHVHDFFAPGNSRFGFDMDRLLAARGHSVHVLAAVGERGPADGATVEAVAFHTYPFRPELSLWNRYRFSLKVNEERFEELHAQHRFDALILNQPLCASGVLRSGLAPDLPKIYWFISPWAAEWREEHPEAGFLKRLVNAGPRNRMEGNALDACDRILVESEFIRRRLHEHHPGVAADKVTLIAGAVDLARFRPEGTREAARARFGIGDGPVVLTVRRLVERMGIDLLLRAAAELPVLEVVVGGDGPRRGGLESLAKSLGVRARFLGFVPDENLPALYRAADLFVLPTRALEGFGLVAVEAMACGTPALGTPVGAIPEVLGPLGLVVGDVSAPAIAAGLKKFFAAPDPDLGRRCREHVAALYDWARRVEQLEEVLLTVIRESPRHRR